VDQPRLLTEYDIDVFHNLYDFHIARTILRQLGPAVSAVGDLICKYKLESHVAVNLLHKHFDLRDSEQVVRWTEGRTAYMSPRLAGECSEGCILPYLWQLADGREGRSFYPLEFATYDATDAGAARAEIRLIAKNTDFLAELADFLWKIGLEDTFGIAALASRASIVLQPGETMLETTDSANRKLTLAPIPEEELVGSETTETLWIFSPARPQTELQEATPAG
jgi:hypothetical protein